MTPMDPLPGLLRGLLRSRDPLHLRQVAAALDQLASEHTDGRDAALDRAVLFGQDGLDLLSHDHAARACSDLAATLRLLAATCATAAPFSTARALEAGGAAVYTGEAAQAQLRALGENTRGIRVPLTTVAIRDTERWIGTETFLQRVI